MSYKPPSKYVKGDLVWMASRDIAGRVIKVDIHENLLTVYRIKYIYYPLVTVDLEEELELYTDIFNELGRR